MSWPDQHPWAALTLTVPATIVDLGDRHPDAAVALTVPATIVGIAAVAAHPFVFIPLLVLAAMAFVVSVIYTDEKEATEEQARVASVPAKRNRQQRADRARAQAEPNRSRLQLEAEAEAAEAQAVAAWARAQVIRLWLEAEASH
jgi:hypothetical protein